MSHKIYVVTLKHSCSLLVQSTRSFQSSLYIVKLTTNRGAWALVPTKLVEPGNALA